MVVVTPFEVGSFVAMMVVHPSAQGRGIGRALMEHALADAAQPVMLYATESGRLLYERMGFVVVDSVLKLGGTPRPTVMSARLRLVTAADLGHVVAAVRDAFGSGRERHIAGVLDGASRAVMDGDGGFAIAWHNAALTIVGPVVARDEDAAIALIDGVLEGNEGVARIDVAVTSPRVIAHARAIGFEDRGASPLMTWPQAARLGERSRYHAILLQGLG